MISLPLKFLRASEYQGVTVISQKVKKEFKNRLTFLIIPHNHVNPLKISLTVPFVLFLAVLWTGITLWAGYLSGRHFDYWKAKMDYDLMRIKVSFFAEEIKKSRGMLEEVKENDENIRNLLNLKSKKAIIENEAKGMGGPTKDDIRSLKLTLAGKIADLTQQDIMAQSNALQKETLKRMHSTQEILSRVDNERQIYRSTPNMWPTVGAITSRFGYRIHPLYKYHDFHTGLDIANVPGTRIYATADGIVKVADWQPGFGRVIVIDHGRGYSTYYGHLYRILIREGEKVQRGDLIALMGSSGTATGTHLHYEVQLGGRPVNPARYLKKVLDHGRVKDA